MKIRINQILPICLFMESLLLLVLVSGGGAQTQKSHEITILGVVRDSLTGKPIQDAIVKARFWEPQNMKPKLCPEQLTDVQGFFFIDFGFPSVGFPLRYRVAKEGYQEKHGEFILAPNREIEVFLEAGEPYYQEEPERLGHSGGHEAQWRNAKRSLGELIVAGAVTVGLFWVMVSLAD